MMCRRHLKQKTSWSPNGVILPLLLSIRRCQIKIISKFMSETVRRKSKAMHSSKLTRSTSWGTFTTVWMRTSSEKRKVIWNHEKTTTSSKESPDEVGSSKKKTKETPALGEAVTIKRWIEDGQNGIGIKCHLCGKVLRESKSSRNFKRHLKRCHEENVTCQTCRKTFYDL